MKNEKIFSPIAGQIIQIEQVADPVFAEKMLGDGIAVRPQLTKGFVVAPCDGEIKTLHSSKHAVSILSNEGYELLIHTGIDTVSLEGKGFESFITIGQKVKKGDKLLGVDFDFISKNAPAYDVIMLITNATDKTTLVKNTNQNISDGEEIFTISSQDSQGSSKGGFFSKLFGSKGEKESPAVEAKPAPQEVKSSEVSSDLLTIINPTGVHARPASRILQMANKYSSQVELVAGEKKANAKSVVAILGLGLKLNDKVKVVAKGDDAAKAVAEISADIIAGLGEAEGHGEAEKKSSVASSAPEVKAEKNINVDFSKEALLSGVLAAPGLFIGQAFIVKKEEIAVEENSKNSNELKTLEDSLVNVRKTLTADIEKAKSLKQTTKVEVFSAHLTILDDPMLFDFAKEVIAKGKTAAFAWRSSVNNSIEILKSTKDALLIERVADLKDLERRVIYNILGVKEERISYPVNSIIVAEDFVPSDLAQLDDNVKGVVLALGSATSHVSLILRNMGIPALVAVGKAVLGIKNNMPLILDANEGSLTVNPNSQKLEEIKSKSEKLEKVKAENVSNAKLPATTTDGRTIKVKGNVSNGNEAHKAFELGGEGVGLLRTEFLFFNTPTEPSVAEQHQLYQYAVDAMQGGSVTLRTLDVGGDKPLSFVKIGEEENPIMGLRGVRNYFNNTEVFLNQVRAILKVKPLMLCKIMIPMVAEISEVVKAKEMIMAEMAKLGIKEKVEIGTMIEVPSAALIADRMAKYVDFFSIGTNDLAQYTLAMDRGNPNLTARLKNLNPALLKLIKLTVDGGLKHGKPTAVCGAMASEVESIPILIGLGIDELSTSMKSIPDVKALVRKLSYKKCVEVANKALEMESSEDVIALVQKEFFAS
ncbi:MAG: phosphoenolpyruvate--protein phosphotransferase [Alphaproteobacteria bacterium]|jgi:phosphoenolpyruvate-protein phosphotransferase|nr:phosphoenolpyruvate--protein phosphotransferase [Alphaproteobacteria bacterium]